MIQTLFQKGISKVLIGWVFPEGMKSKKKEISAREETSCATRSRVGASLLFSMEVGKGMLT